MLPTSGLIATTGHNMSSHRQVHQTGSEEARGDSNMVPLNQSHPAGSVAGAAVVQATEPDHQARPARVATNLPASEGPQGDEQHSEDQLRCGRRACSLHMAPTLATSCQSSRTAHEQRVSRMPSMERETLASEQRRRRGSCNPIQHQQITSLPIFSTCQQSQERTGRRALLKLKNEAHTDVSTRDTYSASSSVSGAATGDASRHTIKMHGGSCTSVLWPDHSERKHEGVTIYTSTSFGGTRRR